MIKVRNIFLLIAIICISCCNYANVLEKELEEFSIQADSTIPQDADSLGDNPENDVEDGMEEEEVEGEYAVTKFDNSFHQFALIRLTNKITAATSLIKLRKNHLYAANNHIQIKMEYCWTAPAYKDPENKAYIRMFEWSSDGKKKQDIFTGWLFSSSPSIAGLEHPIYDIHLVKCQ